MRIIYYNEKRIIYIIIFLLLVIIFRYFVFGIALIKQESKKIIIDGSQISIEEKEIFDLINKERIKYGLNELKLCKELQDVAKLKAEDLVNNKYFSHISPTYGTPFEMLKKYNITYKYAGENLAGNETGAKAVVAWMNSPAHKDNILDSDYEYTGICVVDSYIYGKVCVQLFMGV